jgi:hypothetical protein
MGSYSNRASCERGEETLVQGLISERSFYLSIILGILREGDSSPFILHLSSNQNVAKARAERLTRYTIQAFPSASPQESDHAPTLILEISIRILPSHPRSPNSSLAVEYKPCRKTDLWKVIEVLLVFVDSTLLGLLCSRE